jgi:hypothetical protein
MVVKCFIGLPARVEDVDLAERARQRAAFEASLPPINGADPQSFITRRKMMEEQELREHDFRAEHIKK